MRPLRATLVILLFASGVRGQSNAVPARVASPAGISCSARVPADSCKWITSVFALHQLSSSLRQVEIVIDDKETFAQEQAGLQEKFRDSAQADPVNPERPGPPLGSPYDGSLLFELGEQGYVARVVVSVYLFSRVKFVPDANGVQYAQSTGELDRDSVNSWAFYITGYVEGSRRSRERNTAENVGRARER